LDIQTKREIEMKKPLKNTKSATPQSTALRRRAEKMAHKKAEVLSPEKTRKTLHELQVHQIELEMQNEEMRRAQVELDAARARYFDLYDLAPVSYCTVNEKGLILQANLTTSTLLGVPRGKLVKQLLTRFILKEDQDIFYLYRKKRLDTGEPQTCELRIVKKDGTVFWAHLTGAAAKDESGATVYRVVMSDITERKQVEEALRQSEKKYRIILENIQEGYFEVDLAGNFTFFNDSVCHVLGYSRKELMGMNNRQYTDKEESKKVLKAYNKVYKTGKPLKEFGYWISRKDGIRRYIEGSVTLLKNSSDKPTGFRGITNDFTERKKSEEALRESEIKYRTLFESAGDTIFLLDKDIFIDCNQKALEMFRCTREQIIGQPPYRFSPEVQPDGRNSKEKAVEKNNAALGGQHQFFEWKHLRYDGTPFDAEISLNAITGMSKNYIQAICRDITERRQVEEELKKHREHLEDLVRERTIKLEASNKELEAFSFSASHDLRAPLRTIGGFSQALLEDCEDKLDIKGKDYLIRIKAATRRMADLIEDLLQLSRLTRAEMNIEKINLTRIARSVIDELQKSQPQRHVEIKIADGLEDTADSRLMRITLENLLGNAWKFTGKKAKAVIEFGFTKEGEKKVYFIRDNGAGFDMAYADKLFAPFQRLHNEEEFPGTGIGLALVRRIIHRHGGKVWTEGQTGKGATFYFSLHE
jgi:PAS domain S-box-containing protein